MNNNDWSTFRPGQVNIACLADAVRRFFDARGRLPTEIGVHTRDLGMASAAADGLGLHLPVTHPLGILRDEIWLRAK